MNSNLKFVKREPHIPGGPHCTSWPLLQPLGRLDLLKVLNIFDIVVLAVQLKHFFQKIFFYFTLKLLKCQNELKNLIWLDYVKYFFMFLKGSFTISYLAHNVHYPIEPKDFQAFRVGLVRRLTSAEFAFLFMVSKPYVL